MTIDSFKTDIRCLPRKCFSKNGLSVELQLLPQFAESRLIEMYLAFQPRNCFQGLPPIKDSMCVNWVRDMLRTGINVVAQADGENVIGHAGLFPIDRRKCELLVVVCSGFQNVGIGTELVQSCIDLAGELGFQRIRLHVDARNMRARHVYCKCGFEYVSDRLGREMDMVCNVRLWRTGAAESASAAIPHFSMPSLYTAEFIPSRS